ncbi:MAG: hypothetical protein MJZ76_05800 [Bacteroidales bacterium]|nr:hypothetical protein [Bacteroidales bacterium]
MKKLVLLSFVVLHSLTVFCQKASPYKAYNYYYEKNFAKALEQIDLCLQDEKLATKANTWLYKANICFQLAYQEYSKRQENNSYSVLFPSSPEDAYDAFAQAKSLNKNVSASEMLAPDEGMPKLTSLLLIQGVDLLIAQNFEAGKRVLKKSIDSYEMQTPEFPLNGEPYYYYAYALEMLKLPADAVVYYEKSIADNSKEINAYLRLIESYKSDNKKDKVLEIIEKGKKALPDNVDMRIAEADYYNWIGDKQKSQSIIEGVSASSLTSTNSMVNVANMYIADSNYVEAEKLLQRAYRSSEPNFAIDYNLGVCYYYQSQSKFAEANAYSVKGNKEQAAKIKSESDQYLSQAEKYFEEALKLEANDESVLTILKSIYALKQSPKYDEIVKKLESLHK